MIQQQLGNLKPIGKLNIFDRQNYEIINIDKLIDDWLKEVM